MPETTPEEELDRRFLSAVRGMSSSVGDQSSSVGDLSSAERDLAGDGKAPATDGTTDGTAGTTDGTAGTRLTGEQAVALFDAQAGSRHLDLAARYLRAEGHGFYTIGSAGHEADAAVGAVLRPSDPALLHYRSGAFYLARAAQVPGSQPLRDVLLGLVGASDEPIAGGRHKVFGHYDLAVIPQTSTIASHLPRAVGIAFSIGRAAKLGVPSAWPADAITVASFGDASASHSTATGAINAACRTAYQGLPMPLLLVCEDNGLGISVRTPDGWVAEGGDPPGRDAQPRKAEWDRFTLEFADGGQLALFDKRRLGRIVLNPDIGALGPDAAEVTLAEFRTLMARGTIAVKGRLLDQSKLAGVGNLLADEILWQAKISPATPVNRLQRKDVERLYRALRSVLASALADGGGAHTGDVIAARRPGGRCPRCGHEMVHGTVGGRSTWWCSWEQAARP